MKSKTVPKRIRNRATKLRHEVTRLRALYHEKDILRNI